MNRWASVAGAAVAACLLTITSPVLAEDNRRVVIIVSPGLRADDLTRPEMRNLRALVPRSAVGWMNARTAQPRGSSPAANVAAGLLTLGAGARATVDNTLYGDRIDLRFLDATNHRLDHDVPVGALGTMAHAAGKRTAVLGSLSPAAPWDAGRLLAMDAKGAVDLLATGDVSLLRNLVAPFGIRANLSFYAGGTRADILVWAFGDLARAERYAALCTPAAAAQQRSAALLSLDTLLGQVDAPKRPEATLWVLLSPAPAESAEARDRLTPILIHRDDPAASADMSPEPEQEAIRALQTGLLTCGSTHTRGLVTNTDLLPTIAAWLPLMRTGGQLMTSAGAPQTPELWAAMHDRWLTTARQQAVLGGLPTLQIIAIAVGLAALLRGWRRVAAGIATGLLALPLIELLLPPISPVAVWQAALLLAAALGVAGCAGAALPKRGSVVTVLLGCATVGVVAGDLCTGARLMKQAWMSYSVMEGARYYGIGNEYTGAVAGLAFAGAGLLLRRRERLWPLASALLAVLTLIVGLPQLGAKFGGLLGLAVAVVIASAIWKAGRLRARHMLLALAVAAAGAAVLIAADLLRGSGDQTHIARALTGGPASIALRKVEMNVYLLFHSVWSISLVGAIASLAYLYRRTDSSVRTTLNSSGALRGAAAGLLASAAALFLFDDAGVLAAAECLLIALAVYLNLDSCDYEIAPIGGEPNPGNPAIRCSAHDRVAQIGPELM